MHPRSILHKAPYDSAKPRPKTNPAGRYVSKHATRTAQFPVIVTTEPRFRPEKITSMPYFAGAA